MHSEKKKLAGKSDISGMDRKDFLLLYSRIDPTPFDWQFLNRNSTHCLVQMCYCLGIPIAHKVMLKTELIDKIKRHLYPPKAPLPTPKPAVGAGAAAAAQAAALAAQNAEKEREKEEKKRLKIEMSKSLPPFSGRTRLNNFQYPATDEGDKKKLASKIDDNAIDEDLKNLFVPFDKIPSTAIVIQRGGTTMYAEENDDETRVAYDETSFEGQIIEKILKLITPKKNSKKTLQSIYSIVYLWANIFFAVYVIFYIMFWK